MLGAALMMMLQAVPQDPPAPPATLAAPFATPSIAKSSKTVAWPAGKGPKAAKGFKVAQFATGLDSPRQIAVLPNGDVLVAEARTQRKREDASFADQGANRVTLLRDADGDGVAEQKHLLIADVPQPYGMVLLGDRLYVAGTAGVFWVPYSVGQTALPAGTKRTVIATFTAGGYNNHWTRNLIAAPDGKALFVAVGSASNIGEYGMGEETRRAGILKIDLASGVETVFASGIRNPVGMAIEPETRALWTAVNERDGLGDDLVPDYITSVVEGGFYGWPYSYYGANEDPRLKGQRPDLVAKAIVPDLAMGPHVAALGIAFGAETKFPERYRKGAFVARHGSWNRSVFSGYDLVFVPFAHGKPAGAIEPFLTGFVADEKASTVYGRPRSLGVGKDGALLLSDDSAGTIWRIVAE